MVKRTLEKTQTKSKMKMDGGTKAVQVVNQNNIFQATLCLQQMSNGTSRPDDQITRFAQDCRQSILAQYLSKEQYSPLTGSALPYQACNGNAQNIDHGQSHQYGAPSNSDTMSYANVRQTEFQQQHPSRASRTSPFNQDYNNTSKEHQLQCQQYQCYYAPLNYGHANNAVPQSLNAHTSSQQIAASPTMHSQAASANRHGVTTNGLGQNTYVPHQPPSYSASMASQMTLGSGNQWPPQLVSGLSTQLSKPPGVHQKEGASLPKPIEDKQPRFIKLPKEVQRLLHLPSQYMQRNENAQTQHSFPPGTQNRFHMEPNPPPYNTRPEISYVAANGVRCSSAASESNISALKETSILSSISAPIGSKESEIPASALLQVNKLEHILRDGHSFATSKSSAIDQNSNAAGGIPIQSNHTTQELNGITDQARETLELSLNPMEHSTVKEHSDVTGEDLIKLHKEVMGMREQFVHLLRNYKQKYLEFNSANSDKTLPASHLNASNILKSYAEIVTGANDRSAPPDNTANFQSPPATLQQILLMIKNSFEANHIIQNLHAGIPINQNSHQDNHLNQTSLGSAHESNQLDKTLHVMKDSLTMSAIGSLSSTVKQKPDLTNSLIDCQQSKQKNNLFVSNTTNVAHNHDLSHCQKEITSEPNHVKSNRELASTSPSQFTNLCVSPSGLSTGIAVTKLQTHSQHFKNQEPNATGKETNVTDSRSKKASKRHKKAAGLSFAPMTTETAMRQMKDISLLDDLWKKKPSKDSQINPQLCPSLDLGTVSSSEMIHETNCTAECKTSQITVPVSIANDRPVCTERTRAGEKHETLSSSVTNPVAPQSAVVNSLMNSEIKSSDLGNIPLMHRIGKDVKKSCTGQSEKQNEKDMSLSHHYRMTINSLLDILDSYSTMNCADTEEIIPVDDRSKSGTGMQIKTDTCESIIENTKFDISKSGNVMQIKAEPCESVIENRFDSSKSGNVLQIKTEPCESVIENTKSRHLEKIVPSELQPRPSCHPKSPQLQARDVPLLLEEGVPSPLLKIESICSLVEGNTFYDSQVACVFDTNKEPESKDLDALSNDMVTTQAKVETKIFPDSQCIGDSKGSSDLPLKNYPHPLLSTQTNKREGDFSSSKEEPNKQMSLAKTQPVEENICAKDDVSEPYLNSQLSELLRAFPFGIERTEGAPLIKVNVATENKGMHDGELSKKRKKQNVQICKISPQKRFSAQSLLMNKSSSNVLDKCGPAEVQKESPVQTDRKHSSLDKSDYKKPTTVGHISVTVVDSTKIIINVIESPAEPDEETNPTDKQDVSNFHSEAKIVIEANKQSLGDPCRKDENILADSDDEVVWVKTKTPPHRKSTAARIPTPHNDGSMVETLEKDACLGSILPEISEKSGFEESTVPKTPGSHDRLDGFTKGKKKKTSRLIIKTDFLKSKHSRLAVPVKSNETKVLHQKNVDRDVVKKRCKNGNIAVTKFSPDYTNSGIEKKPASGDKSISSAAEGKLLIENICAEKTCEDAKSDIHSDSAVGKDKICVQAIQEYFQRRREERMSAGNKIPKGDKGAKYQNSNPLIPFRKPSVDLGKLKRLVTRASKDDFGKGVSKYIQPMEMTVNNMPLPTGAKVSSPTSRPLVVGQNDGREMSGRSLTKSTQFIGTDCLKRVTYIGSVHGIIQLAPFDFASLKESDRKQESFNAPLTKKPEAPVLQTVSGKPKMLEFKLCPDLLMGGRLNTVESTEGKHRSGVEGGSRKGIDSKRDDCSTIPLKKRKVDMTEFHGNVVLQESIAVVQMMSTAEKNGPTAISSSQDLLQEDESRKAKDKLGKSFWTIGLESISL